MSNIYVIISKSGPICAFTKKSDADYYITVNNNLELQIVSVILDVENNSRKSWLDGQKFLNEAKDSLGFHII